LRWRFFDSRRVVLSERKAVRSLSFRAGRSSAAARRVLRVNGAIAVLHQPQSPLLRVLMLVDTADLVSRVATAPDAPLPPEGGGDADAAPGSFFETWRMFGGAAHR
jgi:hypothetical protein